MLTLLKKVKVLLNIVYNLRYINFKLILFLKDQLFTFFDGRRLPTLQTGTFTSSFILSSPNHEPLV